MGHTITWLTDLGQKPPAELAPFIAKLPSGMLSCRNRVRDLLDICERCFGTSGRSVVEQGKKCIERTVASTQKNGGSDALGEAKRALEVNLQSHDVLVASLKDVKKDVSSWTVFNITVNIDNVLAKFSELEESGDRILADISHAGKQMANLTKDSRKKDSQDNVNAISITKLFVSNRHIGKLTIGWLKDILALPIGNTITQIPLPGYTPSSDVIVKNELGADADYLGLLGGKEQVAFKLDSQGYPLECVQSWNLFWN